MCPLQHTLLNSTIQNLLVRAYGVWTERDEQWKVLAARCASCASVRIEIRIKTWSTRGAIQYQNPLLGFAVDWNVITLASESGTGTRKEEERSSKKVSKSIDFRSKRTGNSRYGCTSQAARAGNQLFEHYLYFSFNIQYNTSRRQVLYSRCTECNTF